MQRFGWQWRHSVESPWFYAAWFCLFGGLVLLVAHKKYAERQAGIERRFQVQSQTDAVPPAGSSSTPAQDQAAARYSTPENTVIPLWPLGSLFAALACLFAVLAWRAGRQ